MFLTGSSRGCSTLIDSKWRTRRTASSTPIEARCFPVSPSSQLAPQADRWSHGSLLVGFVTRRVCFLVAGSFEKARGRRGGPWLGKYDARGRAAGCLHPWGLQQHFPLRSWLASYAAPARPPRSGQAFLRPDPTALCRHGSRPLALAVCVSLLVDAEGRRNPGARPR